MSRLQQARKATKQALKARIALAAPAGGGKTYTALTMARVLADGGRILVIDTEKESASLYADLFDFDTIPWEAPFNPRELADAVVEAGDKYAVVIIDSLSHFWMGEGGTLDVVDAAAARAKGNSFAGWKEGTPTQDDMVEGLLRSSAHVIATMRSKSAYVLEADQRGKQVPRRVGMAPVQRDGIEYEFTVTAELDYEHNIIIDKTRCHLLSGRMFPGVKAEEMTNILSAWLSDGEPPADRATVEKLVARMNALEEAQRKACKEAFFASFGRPEQLLARSIAKASTLIELFEDGEAPPTKDDATDGGGESDERIGDDPTDSTDASAGSGGGGQEATAPAGGDDSTGDALTGASGPDDAADSGAVEAVDKTVEARRQRLGELPQDLAEDVRAKVAAAVEKKEVVKNSREHVALGERLLAAAETKAKARAQKVAMACDSAGFDDDDTRHQFILTVTEGAVASAKRVTQKQLNAINKAVNALASGILVPEFMPDGTIKLREPEPVAS